MKLLPFLFIFLLGSFQNQAQSNAIKKQLIGGPCEGCEAIHEYGNQKLTAEVIMPGYGDPGQKIKITGTIFQKDGKTPAPNVIIYLYHTDQTGRYVAKKGASGWEKRHGSLRAWLKTNSKGQYSFYTLKPKAYPNRTEPAHIHITVKEPGKNEYYIDSYHFEGDPLLTNKIKNSMRLRGGNGIISLKKQGDHWIGERDIILGLNIPDYW